MKIYKNFFKGKKVIITGHTGFKGSWLTLWLQTLGANILGISSSIPTNPSHYKLLEIEKRITNKKINITDLRKLQRAIKEFKPDYIFHLAAQAIVKKSYSDPVETWKTNLFGTLNILEAIRNIEIKKKLIIILITSDKAYKNYETKKGYKENSFLGGIDPYGGSKSAAEICIQSYVKSFFSTKKNKVFISIARAGNVIGGGDWSDYRLLPDCIKAWTKKKKVFIRNPNSTRPWQHVLDVLNGYISLAVKLNLNKKLHGEAFNFGPTNNKNLRVIDILKISKSIWPEINWLEDKNKKFFENNLLQLNSNKAKKILKWKCILSSKEAIDMTIDWYKKHFFKKDVLSLSKDQIKYFEGKKK
jgi:CDP-glucose 4,6-dehydratase